MDSIFTFQCLSEHSCESKRNYLFNLRLRKNSLENCLIFTTVMRATGEMSECTLAMYQIFLVGENCQKKKPHSSRLPTRSRNRISCNQLAKNPSWEPAEHSAGRCSIIWKVCPLAWGFLVGCRAT